MMNTHTNKIIQDQDVLKFLKELFEAFHEPFDNSTNPRSFFESKFGSLFRQKSIIIYSQSSRESQRKLSDRIEKLLPLEFAVRQSLDNDIPNLVAAAVEEKQKFSFLKDSFIEYLERLTAKQFHVYLPNNLFFLRDVSEVNLGPVTIIDVENVSLEINSKLREIAAAESNSIPATSSITNKKITVVYDNNFEIAPPSSHTMWKVSVSAHPQNANEEALWKIKVASGLIRMIGKSWEGPKPYGNRLERHPTIFDQYMDDNLLRITDTGVSLGGGNIHFSFALNSALKAEIEDEKAQVIINKVLDYKRASVGERVYLALAWLSTARYTQDKSEKLLAIMTAMEAIFTRGKDAPVNETIARLGSVVLANSVGERQSIAKALKTIYGHRSTTVHNGQRSATETINSTALFAIETIIGRLLTEVDLSTKSDKFIESLVTASFGSEWPLKHNKS